ncbi:hypothetical protein [Streptomyces sp. NEAU-W12]|uniref:hypothetical protein n=1 Tax=Streptomyces sp. NEAU-W12 TaxID=2994668 RepID=UPI00224A5C0C|nr:hypothetical protein [Streptomyces sp. NEAU-W12]MCX2926739.1 hypothetical protein [Streptomyces sp. NEAU-W12]
MNRRRPTLLAALALTAATTLTLSACGSGDEEGSAKDKGSDKIAGADTGGEKSAPPSQSSGPAAAERPKIELPSDLSHTFDWPKTGDKEKDAILADSEESIKAVHLAMANQDALDDAYLYYHEGEAAAETEEFIQAYVKEKARVTGAYRYYNASVDISDDNTGSLVYCEDQGKAYDMFLKDEEVNKTPVTKNSYVLYNTRLQKNDEGVWVVTKLLSQRGSDRCQPSA